jgi:quercetin dioxygenase-like cupin family protein
MNQHAQFVVAVTGLCLCTAAVQVGARAQLAKSGGAKRAVLRAASELKWMDAPNTKGVQQAVAWGNPEKGAHGSFAKFGGGTETPMHTHTASGRSVVISGTMVETIEGQKAKELGPGSYFSIPGGLKHSTACKGGSDCLIYSEWAGSFDVVPAS